MENSIPTIYIKKINKIRFSEDADSYVPKKIYEEMANIWFGQVSKDPDYFDGAAAYTEKEAEERLLEVFEERLRVSNYKDYVKHLRFSHTTHIVKNGIVSRF